jgi:hypothetical protein
LLDSFWDSNDLFVVVELAEAGDLASLIEEYRARSTLRCQWRTRSW